MMPCICEHGIYAGPWLMLVFTAGVMIKRDCWGCLNSIVRIEMLGFVEDKRPRKHLPNMCALLSNESQGIDDDQIPS